MLTRHCPRCAERTISVLRLALWRVRCRHCGAAVGTPPARRIPVLSIAMTVWLLALSVLYRDYGRNGLLASCAVWALCDVAADTLVPLVARRR
jgi:prepilin signal peptidase PulO-like enzyme (type II secretory pathway)